MKHTPNMANMTNMTNMTIDIDRPALARQDQLQRRAAELKGSLDAMLAREKLLTNDVGIAKARIALKPEVDGVIESLQKNAHERSVGSFERMLTGITDDVLPDYRGRRQVKLDLFNERNMPALDIYVDNQGNREEVTSGAVANVVSTGLRFIALARSGARRFLVLDEADCWIDGVSVQTYFNVVNQLSRDAGIQTLVISHSDLSSFSEEFRTYRITDIQSPDGIDARGMDLVSAGRMEPNELNPNHISFISAKNFEAYPNAGIELSPGVTVIQGANQRGKSAWRRMLDAALMADAGEGIIRHKNDTAEIAVGFADGRVLEYQRFRKGATKAEFAMHSSESWQERLSGVSLKSMRDGAVPAIHHTVGAKCPQWLPGETGVYEVDGINIQLCGQFSPLFMLDKPASARASLLSIGRESGFLYAMSETYKADLKEDSSVVSKGEKEIAAIRGTTRQMLELPGLIERVNALREEAVSINEEATAIAEIEKIIDQTCVLQARCKALEMQGAAGSHLLDTPSIESTGMVETWLRNFSKYTIDTNTQTTAALPDVPTTQDTGALMTWLRDFAKANSEASMHLGAVLPDVPSVEDTEISQRILNGLRQARFYSVQASQLPELAEAPEVALTMQIELLLERLSVAHIQASRPLEQTLPAVPSVEPTAEVELILKNLTQAQKEASAVIDQRKPELSLPVVIETSDIAVMLESINSARDRLTSNEQKAKSVMAEMEQLEQELRAATERLGGECPVCHSIMTVDMVLNKEPHAHQQTKNAQIDQKDQSNPSSNFPAEDGGKESFGQRQKTPEFIQLARATAASVAVELEKPASGASRLKFRR